MINDLFLTLYLSNLLFCFPLALANICPWPLLPFFEFCFENREMKTTHNTFRDCRVHFFRQIKLSRNSCIQLRLSKKSFVVAVGRFAAKRARSARQEVDLQQVYIQL